MTQIVSCNAPARSLALASYMPKSRTYIKNKKQHHSVDQTISTPEIKSTCCYVKEEQTNKCTFRFFIIINKDTTITQLTKLQKNCGSFLTSQQVPLIPKCITLNQKGRLNTSAKSNIKEL